MVEHTDRISPEMEGDSISVHLTSKEIVETAAITSPAEFDYHNDIIDPLDEEETDEEEEEDDDDDDIPEWRWGGARGPPKAPVGGQKSKQNSKAKQSKPKDPEPKTPPENEEGGKSPPGSPGSKKTAVK
ncbi:hypothetical protein CPB84DRAFT_1750297 [Gymnopilus junonius]|uniref:Uncharacterized protein n=1 Tax=Gymnopilus junonius TaxID=109634 RepID=A0A9P5NHA0_GYMJU|nr:hypothetical protein CPB84DRAFT_1750297 [Gymnopilus junonius]